jgi:hypothetical protein
MLVEHGPVRRHLNARYIGERAEERERMVDLGRDGVLSDAFIEAALTDDGGLPVTENQTADRALSWAEAVERVTRIELALSAWERSGYGCQGR